MTNRRRGLLWAVCSIALLIATAPPVHAEEDEVMTSIQEGTERYKAGDYAEAAGSLEYAAQLIRTKRASSLGDLLPEPLDGWQGAKVETSAVAGSILGGATTASRKYTKGKGSVEVSMMLDSPAIGMMTMLFANPAMAAQSGKKMKRLKNQKVIESFDEEAMRGELQAVIANRVLVTVKGRSTSLEDLEAYIQAIDFEELEKSL